MTRDRGWTLLVGAILLLNALVILGQADGRIEGYVGGVICALGGLLTVVLAFTRRTRRQQESTRERPGRSDR